MSAFSYYLQDRDILCNWKFQSLLHFFYLPLYNFLNVNFKTFLLLFIGLYSGSSNPLFYYCFSLLNKASSARRAEKISFLLNFSGLHDWTASLPPDTAHSDEYWLRSFPTSKVGESYRRVCLSNKRIVRGHISIVRIFVDIRVWVHQSSAILHLYPHAPPSTLPLDCVRLPRYVAHM